MDGVGTVENLLAFLLGDPVIGMGVFGASPASLLTGDRPRNDALSLFPAQMSGSGRTLTLKAQVKFGVLSMSASISTFSKDYVYVLSVHILVIVYKMSP